MGSEDREMELTGRMEEKHRNLIGREFRHFKGNRYRLEGFAKDSETIAPSTEMAASGCAPRRCSSRPSSATASG